MEIPLLLINKNLQINIQKIIQKFVQKLFQNNLRAKIFLKLNKKRFYQGLLNKTKSCAIMTIALQFQD